MQLQQAEFVSLTTEPGAVATALNQRDFCIQQRSGEDISQHPSARLILRIVRPKSRGVAITTPSGLPAWDAWSVPGSVKGVEKKPKRPSSRVGQNRLVLDLGHHQTTTLLFSFTSLGEE